MATTGRLVLLLVIASVGGTIYASSPLFAAQNWPTWAVLAVLPIFVAVLGFALFWLFEEGRRKRLFSALMRDGLLGWLSPLIVAALVFVFAVSVFSVATFLLLDWEAVSLTAPSCGQCPVELEQVFNFYTWHLFRAVPLLSINESLQWNAPLFYNGALAGWLVIAFKAAVIVPLIQAIRTYLQVRKNAPRIRVRPWAWPRVTRPGTEVMVNWAAVAPPAGYVFDVKLEYSDRVVRGKRRRRTEFVERTWLRDTDRTSEKYTPENPGVYRFQATCHEKWAESLAENLREAFEKVEGASGRSVQSWPVTVVVRLSQEDSG